MGLLQNLKERLSLKKIRESLLSPKKKTTPEPKTEGQLQFKIGATSGIYYVARAEDMAGIIEKLSYTLTRGASTIELAADVPHEVDYTQGKELRHIAKKQGLDITFHGALTVPMCMPEIIEWNNAQQHIQKSVLSAVFCGAKYVNFHSCLKEWLELFTYASSRLHIIMSDCGGKFIGEMFKRNEKLCNWFVKDTKYRLRDQFFRYITGPKGDLELSRLMNEFHEDLFKENLERLKVKIREEVTENLKDQIKKSNPSLTDDEIKRMIESKDGQDTIDRDVKNRVEILETGSVNAKVESLLRYKIISKEDYNKDANQKQIDHTGNILRDHLFKYGTWHEKERTPATLEMAYYIIAHDMFLKQDKLWTQMVNLYEKTLNNPEIKYDENNEKWLEDLLIRIESISDKHLIHNFKEFYYGVVGAKFLQSHLEETVRWMEEEAPKMLDEIVDRTEPDKSQIEEQKQILKKNLKDLMIVIENPDARGEHAGRFILWKPKQFLLAIKNAIEKLEKNGDYTKWNKIGIIIDFEHLATQGVDPLKELEELKDHELSEDLGKYTKAVHAGVPTPLHTHKPIKSAHREVIYRLLWKLREVGLGSEQLTYLIFERGGFKDPFAGSVRALKSMAEQLKQGTKPEDLPDAFFVVPKPQEAARQKAIIFDHTFDPIKGMLKFPEEEYTLLGTAALKAGKRPEEWKKEELR